VGFEPTEVLPSSVFGTGALIHSCQPSGEEGAGFEPARVSPTAFPVQRHRPLGEPSREDGAGFEPAGVSPAALATRCHNPLVPTVQSVRGET
jgi:hypothetical protein